MIIIHDLVSAPLQVYGEASIIFPLLVAETFAREYKEPPVFSEGSKPDPKGESS